MNAADDVVFLLDCDNTLLDNDRVQEDLRNHLADEFGAASRDRYWAIFEALRAELGYTDYLGALQYYRLGAMNDPRLLQMSAFLVDYPFADRLYPRALEVLAAKGVEVMLADEDDYTPMHLFGHSMHGGHSIGCGHSEEEEQKGHAGHVPGISHRRKVMKKATVVLAAVLLSSMAAQAQMGGGMMGGGMMNEGPRGESQASRPATPGAEIFRANCASCHPNGGNVVAPNLPLKGSYMLADFKGFLNFIRHPKMPDGSNGAMPAFTESKLSDRQAERLYQFITATDGSGKSGY